MTFLLYFLLMVHILACINIAWGLNHFVFENELEPYFSTTDSVAPYVNQIYFMTTTTTTVGYGDFAAHRDPAYGSSNMLYIMVVQFVVILIFAYLKDTMFSLKANQHISQVIKANIQEAAMFLNSIDQMMRSYFDMKMH